MTTLIPHRPPRRPGQPARRRRCGAAAPRARARDPFPNKPITLVLPFPPGGSFDPIFRALATRRRRTSASRSC